jgi:hypothetical protein
MRGTMAISTSRRTWPRYDPPLQRDLWREYSTCRLHQQPTRKHKRVGEIFGWIRWIKTVECMRNTRHPSGLEVTFTVQRNLRASGFEPLWNL